MQFLLRVLKGPLANETFLLEEANPFVIGRDFDVELSLQDNALSRKHLQLILERGICKLTDLGSTNGTRVNGLHVEEVNLKPGDLIEAGESLFSLEAQQEPETSSERRKRLTDPNAFYEGAGTSSGSPAAPFIATPILESVAPATEEDQNLTPPDGSLLKSLLDSLEKSGEIQLYALIDGAQKFEIAFTARLMGARLFTLFSGELAESLAHVGPCLAVLERPVPFLEKWVELMGDNAGILLEGTVELTRLCAHLRDIFIAVDEEGQEHFFRYYDPRVLRAYLPTCTPGELEEFFGPIQRWIVENPEDNDYIAYSRQENELTLEVVGAMSAAAID